MKFTLTDLLHFSLVLNIFLIVWKGIQWIAPHSNDIWFGLLAAVLTASFKELNDQFGWIEWLLSDGKTRTGFNARDLWIGITLPLLITTTNYILYK